MSRVKELTNDVLFTDRETIAWEGIARYDYPYEVLSYIAELIMEMGENLSEDVFERRGEDIWIAKSASVAPSALIQGPAIIDEGAEIRHCAFIRGSAVVGKGTLYKLFLTPVLFKTFHMIFFLFNL